MAVIIPGPISLPLSAVANFTLNGIALFDILKYTNDNIKRTKNIALKSIIIDGPFNIKNIAASNIYTGIISLNIVPFTAPFNIIPGFSIGNTLYINAPL